MLHRRCSSEKGIQCNRIALIDTKSVKYSCIATSWDLWILFVPQECSLFADRKPVTSYAKLVTVHISHRLRKTDYNAYQLRQTGYSVYTYQLPVTQNWLQCIPATQNWLQCITVMQNWSQCIHVPVISYAKLVTVYTSYQLRKTGYSAWKRIRDFYQWLCTRPNEVSPLPTLLWLPQSWAKLLICIYNYSEYYAKQIVCDYNMGV